MAKVHVIAVDVSGDSTSGLNVFAEAMALVREAVSSGRDINALLKSGMSRGQVKVRIAPPEAPARKKRP